MVKIGDLIKITSDNPNYNRYRSRTWKASHIARSREEHPGYDEGVGGALIDCEGLPFSLYEYEFDIVETSKGKGWRERPDSSGKAPRHRAVANRSKTKNLLRKQIGVGVNLKGFPKLREVVRNYLDKQWDEASNSPESTMLSMGWEPFDVDDSKFLDYMDGSFIKTINGVVKSMVKKAMETDRGLGDDEITELLMWYLTGELDRNSLRDYSDLSDRLGVILSDTSANWIAEGFNKSKGGK